MANPRMVGRVTAKRKVADSKPVPDGFSACTLLTCSCGLCGCLGRYPGKESTWGGIPGRSDPRPPLSMCQSNQPSLAAKRTVVNFIIFKYEDQLFPSSLSLSPTCCWPNQLRPDVNYSVFLYCTQKPTFMHPHTPQHPSLYCDPLLSLCIAGKDI